MIEMLAVLAIIGILSVAAVAGLMWAFAKYKANNTIHDVHLWELAALDSQQLYSMTSGELVLNELGEVSTHGYPMAIMVQDENVFYISVDDVPKRVCSLTLDMVEEPMIVTVNNVSYTGSDICDADTNQMLFYYNKYMGDVDNTCIPACSGCQSCRNGTCHDNNALCGTNEICSSGTCACAPGAIECQGSCYTCPEGYSLDSLTCSCSCDPQECPENATWNSLTCSCECIEGYDMCNNTCHPQCSGSGMTGERDPDTCACICLEGTNADTCACPEGYIYVDGQCQRLYCIGNNSSGYTCYLNGKECGTECSDSKGESCVAGYCYPEQCVENLGSDFSYNTETYWTHSSGCESPNYDLMCSPIKGDPIHWYCKKKIYGTPADDSCCKASSFGKCTIGTCDETDCDLVNGNYGHIAYLTWGCTITHEDKTIYCAPHFNEWACMSSPLTNFTNFCGTCTAEQLKNRECGDCFNDFSCPKDPNTNLNMYLDKTLNRCVLSDESFSCDLTGLCYHGKTDKKCGEACDLYTPSSCIGGLCQDNQCPPGTTYQYFPFSNLSGCEKTLDANHTLACFSQAGGYQRFQCYYTTKNSDGTYANALRCADTDCNLDGTGCKYYYMDECAPVDSETGKKYCLHGNPLTEECICKDGVETNGYCCPPNHTYLNGGCTLINCPDGQVADEGGICKTACENNAEVLNCVCDGTIYTNVFNAKICCESGYSWNENTQTCQ